MTDNKEQAPFISSKDEYGVVLTHHNLLDSFTKPIDKGEDIDALKLEDTFKDIENDDSDKVSSSEALEVGDASTICTDTEEDPVIPLSKPKSKWIDWNIFIDETYFGLNNQEFVTSFFAIKKEKAPVLFDSYKKKFLSKKSDFEMKSALVSDKLNRKILKSTKGYRAIYGYCHSNLSNISSNDKLYKSLSLASLIENYICPIEKVVEKALKLDNKSNLKLHLFIDERTEMQINSDFYKVANFFLKNIEDNFTTENQKIRLDWALLDSKKSIGIQIADMMAGAYRKQHMYSQFEDNIDMLPFKYFEEVHGSDYFKDQTFVKVYGYLGLLNKINVKPDASQNNTTNSQVLGTSKKSELDELKTLLANIESYIFDTMKKSSVYQKQVFNIFANNYSKIFSSLDSRNSVAPYEQETLQIAVQHFSILLQDMVKYRFIIDGFNDSQIKSDINSFKNLTTKLPNYDKKKIFF